MEDETIEDKYRHAVVRCEVLSAALEQKEKQINHLTDMMMRLKTQKEVYEKITDKVIGTTRERREQASDLF